MIKKKLVGGLCALVLTTILNCSGPKRLNLSHSIENPLAFYLGEEDINGDGYPEEILVRKFPNPIVGDNGFDEETYNYYISIEGENGVEDTFIINGLGGDAKFNYAEEGIYIHNQGEFKLYLDFNSEENRYRLRPVTFK